MGGLQNRTRAGEGGRIRSLEGVGENVVFQFARRRKNTSGDFRTRDRKEVEEEEERF